MTDVVYVLIGAASALTGVLIVFASLFIPRCDGIVYSKRGLCRRFWWHRGRCR